MLGNVGCDWIAFVPGTADDDLPRGCPCSRVHLNHSSGSTYLCLDFSRVCFFPGTSRFSTYHARPSYFLSPHFLLLSPKPIASEASAHDGDSPSHVDSTRTGKSFLPRSFVSSRMLFSSSLTNRCHPRTFYTGPHCARCHDIVSHNWTDVYPPVAFLASRPPHIFDPTSHHRRVLRRVPRK